MHAFFLSVHCIAHFIKNYNKNAKRTKIKTNEKSLAKKREMIIISNTMQPHDEEHASYSVFYIYLTHKRKVIKNEATEKQKSISFSRHRQTLHRIILFIVSICLHERLIAPMTTTSIIAISSRVRAERGRRRILIAL